MTSCWNSKKRFRPPSFLKSRKLFSIASCRKWIANFLYQLETFLQFHMAAATDLYDPHPHILVVIWNAFWFLVGCISSPLNHFFVVNCWEHGHISLVLELKSKKFTAPVDTDFTSPQFYLFHWFQGNPCDWSLLFHRLGCDVHKNIWRVLYWNTNYQCINGSLSQAKAPWDPQQLFLNQTGHLDVVGHSPCRCGDMESCEPADEEELLTFSLGMEFLTSKKEQKEKENKEQAWLVSSPFATLSESELENILVERHSARTNQITNWSVSTFKGKYFYLKCI